MWLGGSTIDEPLCALLDLQTACLDRLEHALACKAHADELADQDRIVAGRRRSRSGLPSMVKQVLYDRVLIVTALRDCYPNAVHWEAHR